jgi:hypothetical protein
LREVISIENSREDIGEQRTVDAQAGVTVLDKATNDKLQKDVQSYRLITVATLVDRLKINGLREVISIENSREDIGEQRTVDAQAGVTDDLLDLAVSLKVVESLAGKAAVDLKTLSIYSALLSNILPRILNTDNLSQ